MAKKYLDDTGMTYFWGKLKSYFQPKLVSGTNIKTINNESVLGSGNITISGGGSGTSTPTADTIAKFDSDAHMNSSDMTQQEVSDFVDSLDAKGVTVADYIVEQGTNGIWTYRKWNSGIAECWGVSALRTVSSWSQWGGIYYGNPYNVYDTYPSGLFTELPSCQAQLGQSSGDCYLVKGASGDATKTCAFYPSRGTSGGSLSYTVAYYAIGRWKNE